MSNEKTVPTEQPLEGTVISPNTDVPAAEPTKPSRIKNAFRHPVTTVKKHKLPITAAVAAMAGAASMALLNAKKSKEDEIEEYEEEATPNLTLLESYNDTSN
jgi:hypothetical protein